MSKNLDSLSRVLESEGYIVHKVDDSVVTASTKSNALRAVRSLEKVLKSNNSTGVLGVMIYGMIGILRGIAAGKIANKHVKTAFLAASKYVAKKAPSIILSLGTALIAFFNLGSIFKRDNKHNSPAIDDSIEDTEDKSSENKQSPLSNPTPNKQKTSPLQTNLFDDGPVDDIEDFDTDTDSDIVDDLDDRLDKHAYDDESEFPLEQSPWSNELSKDDYRPRFTEVDRHSVRRGRSASLSGDYCDGLPDTWLSLSELKEAKLTGQQRFNNAVSEDRISITASEKKTVNDAKTLAGKIAKVLLTYQSDFSITYIILSAFKECLIRTIRMSPPENGADFNLFPIDKKRFRSALVFVKHSTATDQVKEILLDIKSYC